MKYYQIIWVSICLVFSIATTILALTESVGLGGIGQNIWLYLGIPALLAGSYSLWDPQ